MCDIVKGKYNMTRPMIIISAYINQRNNSLAQFRFGALKLLTEQIHKKEKLLKFSLYFL